MLYNLTVKWKPAAQVEHHFMKTLVTLTPCCLVCEHTVCTSMFYSHLITTPPAVLFHQSVMILTQLTLISQTGL